MPRAMQLPDLTHEDILACERELYARSFIDFIRAAWPVLEPWQPYVHGWHMDAIADPDARPNLRQ